MCISSGKKMSFIIPPIQTIINYNLNCNISMFAGHHTASYRDVSDRFYITLSTLQEKQRRVTLIIKKNYDRKHSINRIKTVYTFGIPKQKFRQLYYLKLRDINLIYIYTVS